MYPVNEEGVREALYGPHTRSGQVEAVQTPPKLSEDWIAWEAVEWDWPENPDKFIDALSRVADHRIASIRVLHLDADHRISSV